MKLYTVDYLPFIDGFSRTKYIAANNFDSAYNKFKELEPEAIILSISISLSQEEDIIIAE